MEKFIQPATIDGQITAPPSKSDMLRAAAAAYLTHAECEILHPSDCDDALAALNIVNALGTGAQRDADRLRFAPGNRQPGSVLDCGESGLCIRMFPSIAALSGGTFTLTGRGSLLTRPIAMIEEPLRDLHVVCQTTNGLPPVKVSGQLQAGTTTIDASTTSQFLTGLLMALPLCEGDSEIIVTNLASKPYIEMTLQLLRAFGINIEHDAFTRFRIPGRQQYHARSYQVEGDWSGAAFPLVAGAIAGRAAVANLRQDSCQADKAILDALRAAGAAVQIVEDVVTVSKNKLACFEFDATDCPDIFPPLVALATYCQGKSVIHGAQRLQVKESDRGVALLQEFTKMGGRVSLHEKRIEIYGNPLDGGTVDSHNDHRIAMACAVAALGSRRGVRIQRAECVAKSYPEFFQDFGLLTGGGRI